MKAWRTSHFRQTFILFQNKIEHALALCKFQKNNCMPLLAENTERKLNDYQMQLSKYYYDQLKLLTKFQEKYLRSYYHTKKAQTEALEYYRHAQICLRHRKIIFPRWTDADIEFFIARSERFRQARITKKRISFEKVFSCYHVVQQYSSTLIALGVDPSN
jgi:hypothetical protein